MYLHRVHVCFYVENERQGRTGVWKRWFEVHCWRASGSILFLLEQQVLNMNWIKPLECIPERFSFKTTNRQWRFDWHTKGRLEIDSISPHADCIRDGGAGNVCLRLISCTKRRNFLEYASGSGSRQIHRTIRDTNGEVCLDTYNGQVQRPSANHAQMQWNMRLAVPFPASASCTRTRTSTTVP